jgi:transposase
VKERKSRLGKRQQGRLLEHFVAGSTASATAELVGLNRNTAIAFFMKLRKLIAS